MEACCKVRLILLAILFSSGFFSIAAAQQQSCTAYKFSNSKQFSRCSDLSYLNASLHWNYNNYTDGSSVFVDVAYTRHQLTNRRWIAWAINPTGSDLIGSQALVAFPKTGGTLYAYTSPIKSYRTRLEQGALSFPVFHVSAACENNDMSVFATLQLPRPGNSTSHVVNHLWQEGPIIGNTPVVHSINVNSFGTLDFLSGMTTASPKKSQPQAEEFITWDDIKVDGINGHRLSSRVDNNTSRVIVVDKNGAGDSLTVQGAIDMVPEFNTQRVKIYIRPGIYREKVLVPSTKPYISFIGSTGRDSDTVITWNDKASDKDSDGKELGTSRSASVTVLSDYFCATAITFENTVVAKPGGYGMQAVALRVAGDKAFFYRVTMSGTQDTLLDDSGSHYFYKCHIKGTVDFIFGSARSLFQDCFLESVAKRSGAIAAHHRDSADEDTGFSFVHCVVNGTGKILLGRAWGPYSRAVYSFCDIADIIEPSGWSDWNHPDRQKTAEFVEFKCSGRGADTSRRVPWLKHFTPEEVRPFLDTGFIKGEQWLKL